MLRGGLAARDRLVPPSVWLPVACGDSKEVTFESSAQAQGGFKLMLRPFEGDKQRVGA